MNKQRIPGGRVRMWLLAAMSAPLAHFSGCGWLTALLLSAAVLPVCVLPGDGWRRMGKFWCGLELAWFVAAAGVLVRHSAEYWPSSSSWFVPVTLLALSVWSIGSEKGARTGSVLGWILLGLFGVVVLAGLSQIDLSWEMPEAKIWEPELLLALMIPALAGIWTEERGGVRTGAGAAAVVFALLVQGILSPGVSSGAQSPFYEMASSLTAGGICWELPTAVAMTLGWYTLASLLVNAAGEMASVCEIPEKWGRGIIFAGAAAATLVNIEQIAWTFPVISLILWVIIPFLRKMKKVEKSS